MYLMLMYFMYLIVDSVGDGKYLMYLMLWIVLVMESI